MGRSTIAAWFRTKSPNPSSCAAGVGARRPLAYQQIGVQRNYGRRPSRFGSELIAEAPPRAYSETDKLPSVVGSTPSNTRSASPTVTFTVYVTSALNTGGRNSSPLMRTV